MGLVEALRASAHDALEPFRHVNPHTGLWLAVLVIGVALLITWMRRVSWRMMKPLLPAFTIHETEHSFAGVLGLNPWDYIRLNGRDPQRINTLSDAFKKDVVRDQQRYYVVTIVDRDKKTAVLYKELRIAPLTRRGAFPEGRVKFDAELLTHIRLHNDYSDDDQPGSPIVGSYDVYIRPVRWCDIRHWLLHPNREIRIVLWVTLITTTIPLLIEFVGSL